MMSDSRTTVGVSVGRFSHDMYVSQHFRLLFHQGTHNSAIRTWPVFQTGDPISTTTKMGDRSDDDSERGLLDEDSPLLVRHMSMEKHPNAHPEERHYRHSSIAALYKPHEVPSPSRRRFLKALVTSVLVLLVGLTTHLVKSSSTFAETSPLAVPMEHAEEHYVEVDPGIFVWLRTWGNRDSGIPVLFVHGGPGELFATMRQFDLPR